MNTQSIKPSAKRKSILFPNGTINLNIHKMEDLHQLRRKSKHSNYVVNSNLDEIPFEVNFI